MLWNQIVFTSVFYGLLIENKSWQLHDVKSVRVSYIMVTNGKSPVNFILGIGFSVWGGGGGGHGSHNLPPPPASIFCFFFISSRNFGFLTFLAYKICFKPRRTLNGSQETLLGSFLSSPISRAPPAPCSPGLPPPCSPPLHNYFISPCQTQFWSMSFPASTKQELLQNWHELRFLHTKYTLQHGGQYKSYYFVEKSKSYKISPLNAFPRKFRVQDNFCALRRFLASARFQLIV